MWQAGAPDPATLSDDELAAWLRAVSGELGKLRYDWARHARPEQLEPLRYLVWLLLAGRGFGKTRTGAETVRQWCGAQPGGYFAAIGRTHTEMLDLCFTSRKSGLLAVVPPDDIADFNKSKPLLTLTNGAQIQGFSAQEPDALRGYAFDGVWMDEYASWPVKTAQAVYDMAQFCMREAPRPRNVVTSTPKPLPHVKKLVKRAKTQPHKVVITRGRTLDNAANLSPDMLEELLDTYGGTRLGRQELDAELLEDVEGALWSMAWIEAGRIRLEECPELLRRIVSVDPCETVSETSDECGIVIAGSGVDGDDYVIGDRSAKVAGNAAGRRIWRAYADFGAQRVIVEGSGVWMRDILEIAWRDMQAEGILPPGDPPIEVVNPTVSKAVRAEPIAARYERQPSRVHHVGAFPELEEQQTTWTPESGEKSPDRMDALVHGVAWLRRAAGRQGSLGTRRKTGRPRTPLPETGRPRRGQGRGPLA